MKCAIKILVSLLLLGASGCHKHETPAEKSYPVKIGSVVVEDIPHFVKGVGQLLPSLEVAMKSQVSGVLTNVLFADGQAVNEGDLLLTIDPRIFEAQVAQSVAQLAEDQARLRYALEFAETYGKLVGKSYVSRLDYEQAVQNVDFYKASVEHDLASIKKAEVDLSYTQLRAPFKGYVGLRAFDPGNFVDASSGQNLVSVRQVVPLMVRFYLPSEYVQEIRERQKESPLYLEAELPDDPAHPLEGSLWFVNNTVDPQTGLIILQGVIPNEEEKGWPGQFVRVFLRLKTIRDAVLVPKQALVIGENGNYVFIVDEEKSHVSMRMVGKGYVYHDSVVALWGLQGGEKVVIDGQLNLFDGAKVFEAESP